MPTEIIDLDELVAKPKRVKLGGQDYTLPGELPVPLYLRLRAEEQATAEAEESGEKIDQDRRVEDLNELLLDLFRVHQPDIESLPAGLVQMFTIIPRVYSAKVTVDDEEDEDEDAPKARTRAPGKRTSRSRTGSKSAL